MKSLEEIKLRLASSDPQQRIDALLYAWEHGTAGYKVSHYGIIYLFRRYNVCIQLRNLN